MKILFIASVEFSLRALEKIVEIGGNVVGVCTLKESAFNSDFCDLSKYSVENNIPCIYVDDINSDKTIITLSTNEESFNKIKNKSYKLLLHKDGKVKSIPVTFNSNKESIAIAVEDLFIGVNTVTLFDDGNKTNLVQ